VPSILIMCNLLAINLFQVL